MMIDSISHMHGGIHQMIVNDNNGRDALTIPLDLAGFMMYIRDRVPTTYENTTLKQFN
jgi:hypothetical protein